MRKALLGLAVVIDLLLPTHAYCQPALSIDPTIKPVEYQGLQALPQPVTTKQKLVPVTLEDGTTALAVKKKNFVERGYDWMRHQMVIHPKIVRGGKWAVGGFVAFCNIMSAFRR